MDFMSRKKCILWTFFLPKGHTMLFICSYYVLFLFILCSLFVHTMHLFVHTMHLFVHTMHFSLPLLLVLLVLVAVEVLVVYYLPYLLIHPAWAVTSKNRRPQLHHAQYTSRLTCVNPPETTVRVKSDEWHAHLRCRGCTIRRKRNERPTSPCHVNTRTVPYNTPFTSKQSCPGTLVITERHLPLMTFA